eukprot:gene14082-15564_t
MGSAESIPQELRHRVYNLINTIRSTTGVQRSEALREIWLLTENDEYKIPLCDPSLEFLSLITDILNTSRNDQVTLKNSIACICNLSTCQQNKMIICSEELGLLPALVNLIDETNNGVIIQDNSAKKWIYTTLSNCALNPDTHSYLLANDKLRYLSVLKTEMENDHHYLPPIKSFGCISLALQNRYAYLLTTLRIHEIIVNRLISYGPIPANWPDRNTGMAYWSLNFVTSFSSLPEGRKALRSLQKLDFFLQLLSCTEMEGIKASIITSNILCGHEEDLLQFVTHHNNNITTTATTTSPLPHDTTTESQQLQQQHQPTKSILKMYPQIFPTLMDVYSATLHFDPNRSEVASLLSRGFGYAIVKMRDISATLRNLSMNYMNKKIMLSHPSLIVFVLKSIYLFINNTSELSAIYHNYREYAGGGGLDYDTINYLMELLLQLSFYYYTEEEDQEEDDDYYHINKSNNNYDDYDDHRNEYKEEFSDHDDNDDDEYDEEGEYSSSRYHGYHQEDEDDEEEENQNYTRPNRGRKSIQKGRKNNYTRNRRRERGRRSSPQKREYFRDYMRHIHPEKTIKNTENDRKSLQENFNRPEYHMIEMLHAFLSLPKERNVPNDAKECAQELLHRLLPLQIASSPQKALPQHILLFTARAPTSIMTGEGNSLNSQYSNVRNRHDQHKSMVIALHKKLLKMGYDVWRDDEGSSLLPSTFAANTLQEYEDLITKVIQYSYLVIFCITPSFSLDDYARLVIRYTKQRQQSHDLKILYLMLDKDYHPILPSNSHHNAAITAAITTTTAVNPGATPLPTSAGNTPVTPSPNPHPVLAHQTSNSQFPHLLPPLPPQSNGNIHHHNNGLLSSPAPSQSNTSTSQQRVSMIEGWLGLIIGNDIWHPLWSMDCIERTAHAIAVTATSHAKLEKNCKIIESYVHEQNLYHARQNNNNNNGKELLLKKKKKNEDEDEEKRLKREEILTDLRYYQNWKVFPVMISKATQTNDDDDDEEDEDLVELKGGKKVKKGGIDYETIWEIVQNRSLYKSVDGWNFIEELGMVESRDLKYMKPEEWESLIVLFKPIPQRKLKEWIQTLFIKSIN